MARTAGSAGPKTEAAIRAAAVELIARHGYEGVSMRRLADAVGVQAGAIYRYFPNKQALLARLMTAHMQALLDAWRAARPPGDDPAQALRAFARFHVRYHIDRRDEVFINYMELRSLTPRNADAVRALRRDYELELRAILTRGMASGAFRIDDVPVTAMALIAMLTGVTTWRKAEGRLEPEAIATLYESMACRAVGLELNKR